MRAILMESVHALLVSMRIQVINVNNVITNANLAQLLQQTANLIAKILTTEPAAVVCVTHNV